MPDCKDSNASPTTADGKPPDLSLGSSPEANKLEEEQNDPEIQSSISDKQSDATASSPTPSDAESGSTTPASEAPMNGDLSWTCIPRTDRERLGQYRTLNLQSQPAAFGLLSAASGLSPHRIQTFYDGLVERCLKCMSSRTGLDKGDKAKGI